MAAEPFFYSLTAFAFALGAVIGSFLNVVAYRVPAGLSIVRPGSRCPHCKTPIRWYDNIPIVSWFVLEAQCRSCDAPIASRYVFVEALMGFLSAALWIKVASPHFQSINSANIPGLPPPVTSVTALPWGSIGLVFGLYLIFLALLVVISLVDFDHYLIPHEFTLPGIALGVIAALLLNSDTVMATGSLSAFWPPVTLSASLIGLVGGGLAVILLFYVYFALRGIAGLGGGDVTMMALVGAWLGWPALIFVFFAASIQGLIAAAIGALVGAEFLKDSQAILAEEDPRKTHTESSEQAANGSLDESKDCDGEEELPTELDDDEAQPDDDEEPPGDGTEEDEVEEKPSELDAEEAQPDDGEEPPGDGTEEDEVEEKPSELDDEEAQPGDDEEPPGDSDEDETDQPAQAADSAPGGLALPFGPFIALAAIEFFFFGEFFPHWLSLNYLYLGF